MFLLLPAFGHAKHFSTGLRSGIGRWTGDAYNWSQERNRSAVWEKEVYGRITFGRHFAVELGAFQQHGAKGSYDIDYLDTIRPIQTVHQDWNYAFYGLNLHLQYRTNPVQATRLSNYAGAVIAPVVQRDRGERTIYYRAINESTIQQYNDYHTGYQFGVEDMIQYRLSRHIDLHLLLSYKVQWFSGNMYSGNGYQAQAGTAYRF